MNSSGKTALIGGGIVAAAAAAYYFFVYLPGQTAASSALTSLNNGISQAQGNVNSNVTLQQIKALQWIRPDRTAGNQFIAGYDAKTGIVTGQADYANWSGLLLDPQTISWTRTDGQSQVWKGVPMPTGFPSLNQVVASFATNLTVKADPSFEAAVKATYKQSTGHAQNGAWGIDVISNEPLTLRLTKGGTTYNDASQFYVSQHPELAGFKGLRGLLN